MDKYTLSIKSKNQEDKWVSATVGYINPEAQPSELKSLAQGLIALTKNTYQSAERIATTDVDTSVDKVVRSITLSYRNTAISQYVTLDLSQASFDIPLEAFSSSRQVSFTFKEAVNDSSILKMSNIVAEGVSLQYSQVTINQNNNYANFSWSFTCQYDPVAPCSISFDLSMAENEAFLAWSKHVIIHFVESVEQGGE